VLGMSCAGVWAGGVGRGQRAAHELRWLAYRQLGWAACGVYGRKGWAACGARAALACAHVSALLTIR